MSKARNKSRVHRVVLKVRFDKPCGVRAAVEAVRNCVNGDFYLGAARQAGDPEQFAVVAATQLPSRGRP